MMNAKTTLQESTTYKSPLHQMTHTTPTCLWNDSAAQAELAYSIEHGGTGATCNPVIVMDVLKRKPIFGMSASSRSRTKCQPPPKINWRGGWWKKSPELEQNC